MFPIFNIGSLAVQAQGLFILFGTLAGLWLMSYFAKKLQIKVDEIENMLFLALTAGLVSARLGFVLQNLSSFKDSAISIFSLRPTMLNGSFGILMGLIAALIYAQRKDLLHWKTLDIFAVLIVGFMPFWHLGNLAAGAAYGLPTNQPCSILLWGAKRHPVQIYEAVSALLVLLVLLLKTRRLSRFAFLLEGIQFLAVSAALVISSLFFQTFHAERTLIFNRFNLLQIVFWVALFIIFTMIIKRIGNSRIQPSWEPKEE